MDKAFVDTSVILRLLIKDDPLKAKACEKLLRGAKQQGLALYLLPVALLEIVWVLEKIYKLEKNTIRELIEALLNTPDLQVETESIFRKAIQLYAAKNVKFADAVMGQWGLEKSYAIVFTYDEKDFKRIPGLEVRHH